MPKQGDKDLSGQTLGGRYRLLQQIDSGGMGSIYEAEHLLIGRRIAVKMLHANRCQDPQESERFMREARMTGSIHHPAIVEVHDVGRSDDGVPYIVMELLRGQSLGARLRRAPISPALATAIMVQVLDALAAAHKAGIVHRDLKPDNVFLVNRDEDVPHAKLLDFGISKLLGEKENVSLTRTGTALGTPHYMAPEQARGERDLDARIDIWASGVMLYRMLADELPYRGDSYNGILAGILTDPVPPLGERVSNIPDGLLEIVDAALVKDRALRMASASNMARALRGIDLGKVGLATTVMGGATGTRAVRPRGVPPRGVVTLVFTDIEGSAAMWDDLGDDFRPVLSIHDAIMRQAIDEHEGYEVQTAGDAFMVAFSTASNALRFCLMVQQRLHDADWPADLPSPQCAAPSWHEPESDFQGLRVRVGVHTGEPWIRPDPTTKRMDYGGPMCNTAARIGSAAHGGQILASETTWCAAQASATRGAVMVDLGEHALRGIDDRVRIRQLVPAPLARRTFPRIATVDLRKTNLSRRMNSFIGRDEVLRQVGEALEGPGRQVTLVGSAGSGKTRLAHRYGTLHLEDHAGGVWFCDLVNATSAEDITTAVATALGVTLTQRDPMEQIVHAIAGRGEALFILDTFEKVRDLAPETLGVWMQRAPRARFIVTSQARLRMDGERALNVNPFGVDEAIALFEERARAVSAGFEVTDANRAVVTEIVERLDCMALAVELAAARVGLLSLDKLLARLSERFKVLRGQTREGHPRQATLRGAIDWAWDALEPWEQLGLAQCTVFRGGFTLEAAEAVIDVSAWEEAPWEMDVVQSLLDRCMLRVWEPYLGHRRFYLYQSVHAYAEEKLCSPDAFGVPEAAIERVQARHAAHFSDLGTDESLEAMELRSGFALYRAAPFEIDNLIAAVDSADVANQPTTTVRCARAAFRILWRMGPFQRAIDLFERLGDITTLPLAERARLLWSVAIVLRFAGHAEEARGHLEMALKDAECVGDEALAGQIHGALGRVLVLCGDMALGRTHYDLSISLCRRTGARQGEGNTLSDLAIYHYEAGEVDPALARFEETLAIARELGQWRREAMVLNNVAVLLNSQGRLEEGTTSSKAALSIHREMGEKRGTVLALNTLAIAQRELEQFDDSQHSLEEALRLVRELGFRRFEGLIMGNLAELMELQGKLVEAEHLIEEAIEISEQIYPAVAGAFRGNLAVFRARRGEFKDARQLLEDGDALLRGVHELELGKLLCRRGEVECLTGDTEAARTALTEAEDIVAHMKVGPGSELYTMAHALRAKLEA